jgi:hypothetical protein
MKKILSFIVLLAISSMLSFGQNNTVQLKANEQITENSYESLNSYLSKYVAISNSKAAPFWTSDMSNTTDWTVTNASNATIATMWTRLADTSMASAKWKQYVGPYMGSSTPMNGVYYFDGITNLVGGIYGISNSLLTKSTPISTLGHSSVAIKFYQLYKGFNADSTYLEVSNDGSNWLVIDVNPLVSANGYAYGWKTFNISNIAANQAQVYIRFRFIAPEITSSGNPAHGGGYGWMIDDVSLFQPDNNVLQFDKTTLYDAYTNIPEGLGRPMYYEASFTNIGALTQTNIKLHGIEVTTGADSVSLDTALLPGQSVTNWTTYDYFFTPSTIGNYKVSAYLSSDSISFIGRDTFNIKVVPLAGALYSRDYNNYTSYRWNNVTNGQVNAYTAANRFFVAQDATSYGINFVVNKETTIGATVKVLIYKGLNRDIVAESDYYSIKASDIPTATGANPPSISLAFASPYQLLKDTIYLVGVQCQGGTDTVKIATDGTSIPQYTQTSLYFNTATSTWYIWSSSNVSPMMIRLSFDNTIGINELSNNINLFSCMPNPANNSTRISYELKNSENVTILLTDITGRTVMTLNEGSKSAGNHVADVNLTDLTSGTYFYTLKTGNSQATKKMVIVKR